MKRTSYSIAIIVLVGVSVISLWVYQRYIKVEGPNLLPFEVELGDLKEIVRARGDVVSQKEFDLEFPFSGIVNRIFVREGQVVQRGTALMALNIRDLEIEKERLEASRAQMQADLQKEEIALENAYSDIVDVLESAYIKADDAVRVKTSALFSGSKTTLYTLTYNVCDYQAKTDATFLRLTSETELDIWQEELRVLDTSSRAVLEQALTNAKAHLTVFKNFLDRTNATLTAGCATGSSLDTYRTNVSTARTNIIDEISNANSQAQTIAIKPESIKSIEAKVQGVQSQIAAVEEEIRKSTLTAPALANVTKISLEEGEVFQSGQAAISLATVGYKIQADIVELDIAGIHDGDGNEVEIRLDAFPGKLFNGKVVSIEPKEIKKDGDSYYRINIIMDTQEKEIRSGMSADLIITISEKENVLKIPEIAVVEKGDKTFVLVMENDNQVEIEIEIGISDGENVEIISGLTEGQTVVVSAE